MPQLSQIGEIYASQLFWLAIVFALIYFGIGRAMVPKIERTIENRNAVIEQDLATAEATREAAGRMQTAYETGLEGARSQAHGLTADAKAKATASSEALVKQAGAADEARIAEAVTRIDARRDQALAEIEGDTVDAVGSIVAKLSGAKVDRKQIETQVKAALANG